MKLIPLAFFAIAVILVVFISGCVQEQIGTGIVCGNGVVEFGEECDSGGCPGEAICTEKCKCETLSPPSLP